MKNRFHTIVSQIGTRLLYIVGVVLFLILIFFYVVPSFNLYKENRRIKQELNHSEEAEQFLTLYQQRKKKYESEVSLQFNNFEELHEVLLNIINQHSDNKEIVVVDIDTSKDNNEQNQTVSNTVLLLQGNYYHLLQLLRVLEQNKGIGEVIVAHFYVQQERTNKDIHLFLEIHLKNLKFNQ